MEQSIESQESLQKTPHFLEGGGDVKAKRAYDKRILVEIHEKIYTALSAVQELKANGFQLKNTSIMAREFGRERETVTLEGVSIHGGLSAVAAAMVGLGIPRDLVLNFEMQIKAGKIILLAQGTPQEIAWAREILEGDDAQSRETFAA